MTLTGWTLPQTTTGEASLIPLPPWRCSGDMISDDSTADPRTAAGLLPPSTHHSTTSTAIGGTTEPIPEG